MSLLVDTGTPPGTAATAAARASTCVPDRRARPPNGVPSTMRAHGPTARLIVAEATRTPPAASPRRAGLILPIPSTVAAMRNGITAATLW